MRRGLGHAYPALIDAYALALGKLGAVQIVEDISEIEFDPRDGKNLLLWFGPVEQIPATLTIPVLPVVDSGPLIDRHSRPIEAIIRDWAHHLRRCGQAITTSSSIERGIKATLGEGFRVATIPPPMTAPTLDPELRLSSRFTAGQLKLKAELIVLDSSAIKLCADLLVPAARPRTSCSDPLTKPVLQRSTGRDLCAPDDRAMSTLVEDAPHEIATLKMHAADCKATYVSAIGTTEARSNWYDLVTAFCWTFRHAPNAHADIAIPAFRQECLFKPAHRSALSSHAIRMPCNCCSWILGRTGAQKSDHGGDLLCPQLGQ